MVLAIGVTCDRIEVDGGDDTKMASFEAFGYAAATAEKINSGGPGSCGYRHRTKMGFITYLRTKASTYFVCRKEAGDSISESPELLRPAQIDELHDAAHDTFDVIANVVLPHTIRFPTELSKLLVDSAVTLRVVAKLVGPEFSVGSRCGIVFWTPMPEASIDEYGETGFGKNKVGPARQGALQPITESLSPQRPAESHFRCGTRCTDPRHLFRLGERASALGGHKLEDPGFLLPACNPTRESRRRRSSRRGLQYLST
jgi:hypothetical protein